ncbi:hypothetical protein [Paramicrobacterium agarici]|uniref:Uncharacterized protein n=1 Tax=Paramicrobacterium agarici TaxID=630514 RepID=A0A2A9DR96_9MICO|nr:hypothetical protein [Microbacterium agarici]PFG29218.1 hypothetical protein ATJ78_0117 [Microbacterium agarici]TQO22182.1 hypothetical protein FB385_1003 [Microbacterium agarici]
MPDLPRIESWWPHLTVGARHEILEDRTAPISDRVLREIERITDTTVAGDVGLSNDDLRYIETQGETVD